MRSQKAKTLNNRGDKSRRSERKTRSKADLRVVSAVVEEESPSRVTRQEPQVALAPQHQEPQLERPRDKAAHLFFLAMTEFDMLSPDGQEQQIALLEESAYLYSTDSGGSCEGSVNRVLGDLLIASGRFVEALVPLTRACALDEFYAELTPSCTTLTNLGCSYFSLAEAQMHSNMSQKAGALYEQSASVLRRAIACSDGVQDVHNLLAIVSVIEQARFDEGSKSCEVKTQTANFPGSIRSRAFVGIKKSLKIALQRGFVS